MHVAKDVMNKTVVSILEDQRVCDVARLLIDRHISGTPVVDQAGQLTGIISEYQLLAMIYDPSLKQAPVRQFMTKNVMTVDENAPLSEVANLFIVHRIRRVPVVSQGKIVGVISRPDLLRFALDQDGDAGQVERPAKREVVASAS